MRGEKKLNNVKKEMKSIDYQLDIFKINFQKDIDFYLKMNM